MNLNSQTIIDTFLTVGYGADPEVYRQRIPHPGDPLDVQALLQLRPV